MTDRTMDGTTLSPPVAMVKRRAARAVLHPDLLLEGGPLLRVQLRRVRVQVRLHYVDSFDAQLRALSSLPSRPSVSSHDGRSRYSK